MYCKLDCCSSILCWKFQRDQKNRVEKKRKKNVEVRNAAVIVGSSKDSKVSETTDKHQLLELPACVSFVTRLR